MKQVTNLQEIEKEIKVNKCEVVVVKDKNDNIFVMTMEEYNKKRNVIEKLKEAEKEIKNGEGIDADEAFRQLRQKYGY